MYVGPEGVMMGHVCHGDGTRVIEKCANEIMVGVFMFLLLIW